MMTQRNALFAGTLALALGTFAPVTLAAQDTNSVQDTPTGNSGNGTPTEQSTLDTQDSSGQNGMQQQDEEMTPANFVDGASALNMGELDAAEMALDKDTSPEVKQFAQRMQKDHTQAQQKLKQIADSKQLDMSSTADMKSMANAAQLKLKSGASFDAAYAEQQVSAHQTTIDFFQRGANNLKDPELKQFASDTLPTLKEHLQMAQELQKKTANQ